MPSSRVFVCMVLLLGVALSLPVKETKTQAQKKNAAELIKRVVSTLRRKINDKKEHVNNEVDKKRNVPVSTDPSFNPIYDSSSFWNDPTNWGDTSTYWEDPTNWGDTSSYWEDHTNWGDTSTYWEDPTNWGDTSTYWEDPAFWSDTSSYWGDSTNWGDTSTYWEDPAFWSDTSTYWEDSSDDWDNYYWNYDYGTSWDYSPSTVPVDVQWEAFEIVADAAQNAYSSLENVVYGYDYYKRVLEGNGKPPRKGPQDKVHSEESGQKKGEPATGTQEKSGEMKKRYYGEVSYEVKQESIRMLNELISKTIEGVFQNLNDPASGSFYYGYYKRALGNLMKKRGGLEKLKEKIQQKKREMEKRTEKSTNQ